MRNLLFFSLISTLLMFSCSSSESSESAHVEAPDYASWEDYPNALEESLWLDHSASATTFKVWSPPAEEVIVKLYEDGFESASSAEHALRRQVNGVWSKKVKGDLAGKYYTYQIKIDGEWSDETPGIYAQAVGVNGKRAMVLDISSCNPADWASDSGPKLESPNDAIIYELHVRDLSIHPNANSSHPGKYLGLVESGVEGPEGVSVAIDHMKELGVTHVHLLPSYDHYSIDETKLDVPQFNWGYDPQNYNVPEGSFSSDPFNAEVRIKEFKEMVQAFHEAGIGVILDVVYNHTGRTAESNFNQELPDYYYRLREDGSYSDASACGNETASEKPMMRKFMVESVLHWVKEYHLDGFRFDLMGIHDVETMNAITEALHEYDADIFVYGEGWTAGGSPLAEENQALKKHTLKLDNVSAFSDDLRDGLKGSVFVESERGFVSGADGKHESIKFGLVGSINHPDIDYAAVNYSDAAWTREPWQAVSYVSCHDNNTLFDKLTLSCPDASDEEIQDMHQLALSIVLTSQGISFLHAGTEMMRTKDGVENSFESPDSINQIDWNWKVENREVFDYVQGLIELRKNHPAFRMRTAEEVQAHLHFLESSDDLVAYQIDGAEVGDSWNEIMVFYNASETGRPLVIQDNWKVAVLGDQIDEAGITSPSTINIPAISMAILYRD
jgi:pullulanase